MHGACVNIRDGEIVHWFNEKHRGECEGLWCITRFVNFHDACHVCYMAFELNWDVLTHMLFQ